MITAPQYIISPCTLKLHIINLNPRKVYIDGASLFASTFPKPFFFFFFGAIDAI